MSIENDIKRLAKKLNKISTVEVPRAAARALNRSATTVRKLTVQDVSRGLKLPAKEIRKRAFFSRANAKKQRAKITAYARDVSVISLLRGPTIDRFMGTGTNRKGVRARGRQFDAAFINQYRGRAQVFRRLSNKSHPIEVVKIPINNPLARSLKLRSRRVMQTDFRRIFKNELQFRLKKYAH